MNIPPYPTCVCLLVVNSGLTIERYLLLLSKVSPSTEADLRLPNIASLN